MNAAISTLAAKIDAINQTDLTIKAQRDEAQAALRDIIFGCDGMLQPALNVTGAMRGFIEEVKRVAKQGLES